METQLLFISVNLFLLAAPAIGSTSPPIFIFGDSILDAGNNHYNPNCTVQADFPPYGSTFFRRPTGRFTNGRTVADFISEFLRIPLQKPYMEIMNGSEKNFPANGINFASAGSGVLPATNNFFGVTPIQVQVQQFQSLVAQNKIGKKGVKDSMIFIESGSNDIYNYFYPLDPPTLTPDAYVQSMVAQVGHLVDAVYNLGGRRVAVFGLGPVGCVPARSLLHGAPLGKCYGKMNKMVKNYNMGLQNLVNALPRSHPGAVAVFGAVYETIQIFRAYPTRYGFVDVEKACCGNGKLGGEVQCGKEGYKVCKNPNQYLFWDFFHPSERTYKLIAKALWAGGPTRIRPFNLNTLANMSLV
ncbi:GDSL esterase/lipase 6 isoform X1 [Salvia miltiorrhiza]|uniref:GDSL esterase/lipase 6 isoform X1 n=1 Tax=Salvia miltiorrhiza TaxID=226208 RepID=UPI0025AB8505|nr:GDSL esterase/lipase 6 isoform X1 [Salvia miltiorrhiza]XP_057810720.1 GDSL esterase/lipase 6 isoform X2 [Salvia miltiorrhiza]XP_057810721.1 GDSL esterase/lipase 6 isoform X1 [Salvia miltiorrhiza]